MGQRQINVGQFGPIGPQIRWFWLVVWRFFGSWIFVLGVEPLSERASSFGNPPGGFSLKWSPNFSRRAEPTRGSPLHLKAVLKKPTGALPCHGHPSRFEISLTGPRTENSKQLEAREERSRDPEIPRSRALQFNPWELLPFLVLEGVSFNKKTKNKQAAQTNQFCPWPLMVLAKDPANKS